MAAIGMINELEVVKLVDFGVYLDGGKHGEILMPRRYVPEDCKVGDLVKVFIYLDSEDRLVATTETPIATVGQFAMLKTVAVNKPGAFMDWGLMKDLFVPFREQKIRMQEGESYLVYIYIDDESQRIVGTTKLDHCLDNIPPDYEEGEEVNLIIAEQTELGFKAIVDNSHWGMLYKNEVFQPLHIGDHVKAYIKQIRPDEKIDLSLEQLGYGKIEGMSKIIFEAIKKNDGHLALTDKSDPEEIKNQLGISKKNFKKAVGALYKQKLIRIEPTGIYLV